MTYAFHVRQIFSIRFVAALAALVALAGGLLWAFGGSSTTATAFAPAATIAPAVHRVDLVALVYQVQADPGFTVADGVTVGNLKLIIDASRTLKVPPGTMADVTCRRLADPAGCVLVADLLGESAVWLALIPSEPRASITLPPIRSIESDNWVALANGWEVHRAPVVELRGADDFTGLGDFVRRCGDQATSTFNFDRQQISRVTCDPSATAATDPTTTVVPTTVPGDPGVVGGVVDTGNGEVPVDPVTSVGATTVPAPGG